MSVPKCAASNHYFVVEREEANVPAKLRLPEAVDVVVEEERAITKSCKLMHPAGYYVVLTRNLLIRGLAVSAVGPEKQIRDEIPFQF